MRGYKPFTIAPFSEGMDKSLAPWLTPDKSFIDLENVYIDKGVIKERRGVTKFGRLGLIVEGETGFANVAGNRYTINLAQTPVIPFSFSVTDVGGTGKIVVDNGFGDFTGNVSDVATNLIDYTSSPSTVDITFDGAITGTLTAEYHYYDTAADRNVRGIHYFNKDLGTNQLLASDAKRLSLWDTTNTYFDNVSSGTAITGEELVATGHGTTTGPFTGTASKLPVIPYTVRVYDSVSGQELFDNGRGSFIETQERIPLSTARGTINYATGLISGLYFTEDIANADPIDIDYYHGDTLVYDQWDTENLQFGVSWQNNLWFCDDETNIKIFSSNTHGTGLINITPRLVLNSDGHTLESARIMVLFKDRPIFFNTVENGTRYSNRARFPARGNSLTVDAFRDDYQGYGDYNDAPTNDEIIAAVAFKDRVIVFFEKNIGFLKYTGNPETPFVWEMLNSTMETDSTFGFWNLSDFVVALGKYEMTACDGVRAQKANTKLPDFCLDLDYSQINKCFGYIIPSKKQAWLAYPSMRKVGQCDKVLIFNYEDGLTSMYDFYESASLEPHCFGEYDYAAASTFTSLQNFTFWPIKKQAAFDEDPSRTAAYFSDYEGNTFEDLSHQAGDQVMLMGSSAGYVYIADDENASTDNGFDYNFRIKSKRFNPFSERNRKTSLGYIDLLVGAITDCEIEVNYSLGFNDDRISRLTKKFVCTGNNADKVWKRVNCNAADSVISFTISHPEGALTQQYPFELHATKLYFKDGGRLI